MKTKNGMRALSLLMIMIFASMIIIPAVSAEENNFAILNETIVDVKDTETASEALLPYVNIEAYGPTSASINQKVSIDVSGECGNMLNYYFQKFYIQDVASGTYSNVEYISTPSGFSCNLGTWSKGDYLVGHTNFNSHWEVKFKKSGRYEVVASAVGVATIPSGQKRFVIDVS